MGIDILEDHILRINLATTEDIRWEMDKVYRETRYKKIIFSKSAQHANMLTDILRHKGGLSPNSKNGLQTSNFLI